LLANANSLPSTLILFTLMTEAIFASEMPVPTRTTQRHIPEEGILHSHRSESVNSYKISGVSKDGIHLTVLTINN
jgi:hypothetical protein